MPREKEAGLGGMKAVADTVGGARGRPESSKEARETGDVKTGRKGTAGRKNGWKEGRSAKRTEATGAEPTNRAHGYDTKIGPWNVMKYEFLHPGGKLTFRQFDRQHEREREKSYSRTMLERG